mgnify:CR=1 FL=1
MLLSCLCGGSVEVELGCIRRTGKGYVVADLFLLGVKFRLYMRRDSVALRFGTTNKSRAELAVQLLEEAGVDVKVCRNREVWHIFASLKRLAGADKALKEAVVASIKAAAERGWIDASRAQRWIAKAECARIYNVRGKLAIYSKRPEVLEREAQRLRDMGLVEGLHFTAKMPEGGRTGRLRILAKGLAHAAWLAARGSGRQRELAREFLGRVLSAAQMEGEDVYRRVKRIVDAGISQGPASLRGLERDAGGRIVKVKEGSARLDEDGRLRIAVTAEVDGIYTKCEISFVKLRRGGVLGFAYAGAAEEAERIAVVVKAVTGMSPAVAHMKNGTCVLRCSEKHLRALARYAELAGYVEKWIKG